MHQSIPARRTTMIVVALIVTAALLSSLLLVTAQETDGRINAIDHVGGAAVYCVDAQFEPADNWSDGGIRVLDARGQELMFAPAAAIMAEGDPPEVTVHVGAGANAYGPLDLYYRPDSKFQLMGTDEHGKAFEFVWGGCSSASLVQSAQPVLPTQPARPTPEVTDQPDA